MRLSAYLEKSGMTAMAFARRIDRAPSTVTRILKKEHMPDSATLRRIVEATDGAVTPNDFYMPDGDEQAIEAANPSESASSVTLR